MGWTARAAWALAGLCAATGTQADPADEPIRLGRDELTVFSAPGCRYCGEARAWLRSRDLAFRDCDIVRSPRCADELAARGGRGVPHFTVRGHDLAGYNASALEALLRQP